MGVPALFRWLSKKYPKIITTVVETEETTVKDHEGNDVLLPVDALLPNPNGFEADNLYLDMNGIVHPCTHPEGKPPPETEEDMMVEIFNYTERVVNMVRPRKLLFMAIDGVAPRAKMNQQRSRRFRAAQEAQEKEKEREVGIAMFEAMGHVVSEETKNKKSWDTNAITPGTPFMQLLASSLRYWVTRRLNADPAWKNLKVIISDAGVPGEGEHKIMDFIRRQRVNPGHDPNTEHVIYGLDADLIMLSLATHEPRFRVLREDVFAQEKGCRTCGEMGHYADRCPSKNRVLLGSPEGNSGPKKPTEKKPFIFLDVSVLREYLQIELNVPHVSFAFDMERAIDDWIFLIFFVGNDFLPHLPSLEIREGAIDTLLRIWREELPRMGGYLTNHGFVVMERAQRVLEGLARREDDIFRRRREAEERQDQNSKRQRIEGHANVIDNNPHSEQGVKALSGSNADVVNNRRAIRLANMTAAEHLKAELASRMPLGRSVKAPSVASPKEPMSDSLSPDPSIANGLVTQPLGRHSPSEIPVDIQKAQVPPPSPSVPFGDESAPRVAPDTDAQDPDADQTPAYNAGITQGGDAIETLPHGLKRKADLMEDESTGVSTPGIGEPLEDEDEDEQDISLKRKVNPDGTVEQVDTVRLWEPGYKERYYQQKFGTESGDAELRQNVTKAYLEGLCWVLHYYYQGPPSWQWFYPYHFAPFASDFEDVASIEIQFTVGSPFKPFEQLMGVFPPASRKHLPEPLQQLMVDSGSPILDFYPETFEIDMNGKKMAWQGVALLPFIDQNRLLAAMVPRYPELTEEELQRNSWGNNAIFISDAHPLYDPFCTLYTKKRSLEPVPLDVKLSCGLSGSLLADPTCLPGSTYFSPLSKIDYGDIHDDRSISALYFYPKQLQPHRSRLLPGAQRPRPTLTSWDYETTRRGQRGRGGSYGGNPPYGGGRDGYHTASGFSQVNDRNGYGWNDYHSESHNAFRAVRGGTHNRGISYRGQSSISYPYPPSPYPATGRYSNGDHLGYGGYSTGPTSGRSDGYQGHGSYGHPARGARGGYSNSHSHQSSYRGRGRR